MTTTQPSKAQKKLLKAMAEGAELHLSFDCEWELHKKGEYIVRIRYKTADKLRSLNHIAEEKKEHSQGFWILTELGKQEAAR